MEKRKHKHAKWFRHIFAYVLTFAMIVGLMPVTMAKAEAGSDETGLYFAEYDWATKTMSRLSDGWYTEIPDKTGFALIFATKGETGTTYRRVDMSKITVTYNADANDENPSALAFSQLEEGQMTESQLSEEDYNNWAAKEINGGDYFPDNTIPVSWYDFNKTGTYKFVYTDTEGGTEYACYLYRYNRAWDFYETNVVTDNPLRDYYYQDITEDTGFYLNQADDAISLGKLTYDDAGNVVMDDVGKPVLEQGSPLIAARFQRNELGQEEIVGDYSGCISYNSETGKISIISNPSDNVPDYAVRVYFYVIDIHEEDGQPVTNYRQESTDIWVHHGEDMSNAIWLGYDDRNGTVSWKLRGSAEESPTVLTPHQDIAGQADGVYDVYLTEKPGYPEDFDWGNVTPEEDNKYGRRAGAEPVVYIRNGDTTGTYRVDATEQAYKIDDCGDNDNTTWHFTYTYKAGDGIDAFWSDYDAFSYDATKQFQLEIESLGSEPAGTISISPTPAGDQRFASESYGEKCNFPISEIGKVSVTVTPNEGNTLEEVRIGETTYVNEAMKGQDDDRIVFTPSEDGSFSHTFTEDELKAYRLEKDENGEDVHVPDTDENGNQRYASIYVRANFSGQQGGPDGPGGGSSVSEDFTVQIGNDTIYRATVGEGESKITVSDNASYDVEEIDGGIAIKPKRGTDTSGDRDADITTKQSITLDPIVVTGNGCVEVHAGLNYTPEGTTDGSHVEEVVPIIINASDKGYSFEADGDADFRICGGNFRSTATLKGGVKARGFTLNDMAKLTIGSIDSSVAEAFCAPLRDGSQMYESSSVEFNLAKVEIYAAKGFTNYNELRAWDEADVNVSLSGVDAKMFDNVNIMEVQTGGKFTLKSESTIQYPENFKAQAGYYTELGEILNIANDGRFQDAVIIVDCEVGDYSESKGRYIYSINEGSTEITLESASKTLWPLGYSFLPDSGDQYVKNGHFEISAGSGLCREGMTDGGEYFFEKGTEVTFKLVPDTGYQYKAGTFKYNGSNSEDVVKPTNDPGVYIFTMQGNPIHVSCEFEKVEDAVDVKASAKVAGADIAVPDGAICGTAEFSVEDATLTPEQNTAFESVAEDKTIGATLDLSMNEVINKIGTDGEAWVTPVHDLEKAMDVSLKLDDSIAGQSDYVVIREHNGKTEALDTKYDADTNSVSFATDGYSTYAIAYKNPVIPQPPAHVHAGTRVAAVAATCTAAGNSEYYTCACGKYFSDAACTKEIVKDSWVIAATGHKWDGGTVTKEATATEDGVKIYHCTNAGCTETKTEVIGKTGTVPTKPTIPSKGKTLTDSKSGFKYKVSSTGTKNPTVTYTGATNKKAKTVSIPATVKIGGVTYKVTSVASNAFKGNKTITKVTIGSNITQIGSNAFNGCTKLTTITIGKNVTSIGTNAFKGCSALTKITLPAKVTTIAANAFSGCKKLKTITIKSTKMTNKTIAKKAFKGVTKDTTIKVPGSKVDAYKKLFQSKGLSSKVKVKK